MWEECGGRNVGSEPAALDEGVEVGGGGDCEHEFAVVVGYWNAVSIHTIAR